MSSRIAFSWALNFSMAFLICSAFCLEIPARSKRFPCPALASLLERENGSLTLDFATARGAGLENGSLRPGVARAGAAAKHSTRLVATVLMKRIEISCWRDRAWPHSDTGGRCQRLTGR